MKTLANRLAMFAAAALTLGGAAYGQTLMKADIPFAFRVVNQTLPAGTYNFVQETSSGGAHVRLWNADTRQGLLIAAGPVDYLSTGVASVGFNCNSTECVLTKTRSFEGTVSYPAPRKVEHPMQTVSTVSIPLMSRNGQ